MVRLELSRTWMCFGRAVWLRWGNAAVVSASRVSSLQNRGEERVPDQSWLTELYLWISIDPVLTRIPKAAVTFHGRTIN